jgi:hypothetical protein
MVLLLFFVGGLIYFDNPIKSCVKNTVKSGYGKDSDGEIVHHDSILNSWFVKPIKKLFGYDKGKERAKLADHYDFEMQSRASSSKIPVTPVNDSSSSSEGWSSTFSHYFKKLWDSKSKAPTHVPSSPESPLAHKNRGENVKFGIGEASEYGGDSTYLYTSNNSEVDLPQATHPVSTPISVTDQYGNVREALHRRIGGVDPSYTNQSIDYVHSIQYDFDWSTLQDPRKDLLKGYVQSYGAESFISDNQSDIVSETSNTPSLVTDNGSSVESDNYLASTDIFDTASLGN